MRSVLEMSFDAEVLATYLAALSELIQIDYRWGGGDVERTHAYAAELVRFKPDVSLCPRATRVTCA
jgi:hypothetical protein